MRSIFTLTALAVYAVVVSGQNISTATLPKGIMGHTAILANNTVFIQGGATPGASGEAYAILLTPQQSMENSTTKAEWRHISRISQFPKRDFFAAAAIDTNIVSCGTRDGGGAGMTCESFDVTWYNHTGIQVPSDVMNRGGMAYTTTNSKKETYFLGGATNPNDLKSLSPVVNVLTLSPTGVTWKKITDMTFNVTYHSATWIDGSINGILVIGGQYSTGAGQPLSTGQLYSNGSWSDIPIITTPDVIRFGHTVTNDNGTLYLFGGVSSISAAPSKDMYILDTTVKPWTWQVSSRVAPEARAFHAATLLKDRTILYTFGQTGADPKTATNTYMIFNLETQTWGPITAAPPIISITESPNYVPPPPPDNNNSGSDSGSGSPGTADKTGLNIAMIAGICGGAVVLLFLIIIAILLVRRRRNRRNRPVEHYSHAPQKDMKILYNNTDDQDDDEKSKRAKAFMIQKPASVYVVDDQDPEQVIPHPQYKSAYYGDGGRHTPSIAEPEEDDDYEESLPRNRNNNGSSSSAGPRYPRAQNNGNGRGYSQHPTDDYY